MKILVPVDFSPASRQAYRYALFIAQKTKASLVLLHVFDIPAIATDSYVYMPSGNELELIRNNHILHLKDFSKAHKLPAAENIISSFECAYGLPAEIIMDISVKESFDLIIMGIQGKCIRPYFFMGSTFTQVMNRSTLPVIGIHGSSDFFRLKHILFAYDLKKFSDQSLLQPIIHLARDFDARIHILNVTESLQDQHSLAQELQNKELNQFIKNSDVSYHVIQSSDIVEGIKDFIIDQPIDLICFVPRDHNILASIFIKSVSKKAAFDINLPFMSIHN